MTNSASATIPLPQFRAQLARYMFLPQLLAALVFLFVGYRLGDVHLRVLRNGARAEGTIVGHKERQIDARRATSSAFMPIVRFAVGTHGIEFEDRMGSNSTAGLGGPVAVLYDRADPTIAMIDRGRMNWFPWGIPMALGLFMLLVAIQGAFAARRRPPETAQAQL